MYTLIDERQKSEYRFQPLVPTGQMACDSNVYEIQIKKGYNIIEQIKNILFITFSLKKQSKEFEINCRGCREIIIPDFKKPVHIKGFIELDGKHIPVVDPGIHFRGEPTELTDSTCIVIVEHSYEYRILETGILVSDIEEVMNLVTGGHTSTNLKKLSFNGQFIHGLSKYPEAGEFLTDSHLTLNICKKQKYLEDDFVAFKQITSKGLVYA